MSFSEIISNITIVIEHFGARGVFIATIIEEIIAPIPSALTLLASGFFLIPAASSFSDVLINTALIIVLPATVGLTLGSLVLYGVAYVGGRTLIEKFGKWFGVSWEKVTAFEKQFTVGYADEFIVFLLRAVPVVPNALVSLGCGAIRYPLKSFFVASCFGNAVRAFSMGVLGWFLGRTYLSFADQIQGIESLIFFGFIAIVVVIGVWLFVRKKLGSKGTF